MRSAVLLPVACPVLDWLFSRSSLVDGKEELFTNSSMKRLLAYYGTMWGGEPCDDDRNPYTRMKKRGMRCKRANATAVVTLRVQQINAHWHASSAVA